MTRVGATRHRPRRIRAAALLVIGALVALGCGGGSGGGGSFDAESRDPTTEEAKAYGLGPQPNDDVTFQPDVVIVAGAGRSVRSVTDGGLTWVIDAGADGADDLEPGKIMFVTGRGVGRVLHLEEDGDDLAVTIGPVTLTDVIRDGTFRKTGIVLDEPVEYATPGTDWEAEAAAEDPDAVAGLRQAAYTPVPEPAPKTVAPGSAFPTCCSTGIGAHFSYDQGGTKLNGTVELTFAKPDASFYLSIANGKITKAEVKISGGLGTRLDFQAGIDGGVGDKRIPFPLGAEFGFPIAQVLGVPLTFTIGQSMAVTTAFGTKLGTISGNGSFSLAGSVGYAYEGGTFGPRIESSFKKESSLINSLSGVPVGVMGILVQHHVRFSVGFSAHVLKAGVWVDVRTAYGVTRGSALGAVGTAGTHFVECQGVGLGVFAVLGIGVTILEPVVKAINRFLSLINVGPIPSQIGPESAPIKIYANEEVIPDVQLCGHTPGGSGRAGGGAGGTGSRS